MADTYDYDRAIQIVLDKIKKYGGEAILRRKGVADRFCLACIGDMSPNERRERLINPVDRLMLVAVKDPDGKELDPPPFHEQDSLVTLHPRTGVELETLRIVAPVVPFAPGFIPIYYELICRNCCHASV